MPAPSAHPIPNSYWIQRGYLLAGAYPGDNNEQKARENIRRLLKAGVTTFLDLTEKGERGLLPYKQLAMEEGKKIGRKITYRQMAVSDFKTITKGGMRSRLNAIDKALEKDHTVYVHCNAGLGRTGMVVGCYLVRHGMSGEKALNQIKKRRSGTPKGGKKSPENPAQRAMVLEWDE